MYNLDLGARTMTIANDTLLEKKDIAQELVHFEKIATELMNAIHTNPQLHRALRVKDLQPIWERLQLLALFGMNMVSAGNLPESGEEISVTVLNATFPEGDITVFDVGANMGDYTGLVLDTLGTRARIWSFEPLPGNFTMIQERFSSNPQVHVSQMALGEEVGNAPFFVNADHSTIGSIVHRHLEHENISMQGQRSVSVDTLDAFCSSKGIDYIHLLKIDVEGAELHVIRGAKRLIESGRIPLIQFELSMAQIDAGHFFKDFFTLLSPRYRMYRILSDGLSEIREYEQRHEVFWCTNYLAILKS